MLKINQLSYWERTTYFEEIDLLIVGAGIVGLSTAIAVKKNTLNGKLLSLKGAIYPAVQVQKMLVLLVSEVRVNYLKI